MSDFVSLRPSKSIKFVGIKVGITCGNGAVIPTLCLRVAASMPLTDTKIRKLKPSKTQTRHADGEGLSLLLKPNGSKLWRFRYRFNGKQKDIAFGKYPAVSLGFARERRAEAKALLARGIDPSAARATDQANKKAISENTFDRIASEMMDKLRAEGMSDATLRKKSWFLDMASVDFGGKPIGEVSSALILKTLKKVEAKGHYESAQRLRSTIGQVCRFAISTARLDNDPTYALRGALISHKVRHQPAIVDRVEFAELVSAVWQYHGSPCTKTALKLLVLLYPRPGELRLARWQEFDLKQAIWTIPPEHEKNRRTHIKPLSTHAVELLRVHHELSGHGDLVFPMGSNPRKPLSENALNQALHRLGYRGVHTSHGFRASASTLLNESGMWIEDAIETELCHIDRNQSRRPYNRARYWDERVKMAEWWGELIDTFSRQ